MIGFWFCRYIEFLPLIYQILVFCVCLIFVEAGILNIKLYKYHSATLELTILGNVGSSFSRPSIEILRAPCGSTSIVVFILK